MVPRWQPHQVALQGGQQRKGHPRLFPCDNSPGWLEKHLLLVLVLRVCPWLSNHAHQCAVGIVKASGLLQTELGQWKSHLSIICLACRITNFCEPEGCSFRVMQVTEEYKWPVYRCQYQAEQSVRWTAEKRWQILISCCLAMGMCTGAHRIMHDLARGASPLFLSFKQNKLQLCRTAYIHHQIFHSSLQKLFVESWLCAKNWVMCQGLKPE